MAAKQLGALTLTVGLGWAAWSGVGCAAADSTGSESVSGPGSRSAEHGSARRPQARQSTRTRSENLRAPSASASPKVATSRSGSAASPAGARTGTRPGSTLSAATLRNANLSAAALPPRSTAMAGQSAVSAYRALPPAAAVAPAVAPATGNPVQRAWSFVGSIVDSALGVIQHIAAPFPTRTGEPPLGWLVVGWVRREIGSVWFNSTPTAQPVQIVQALDSTVTGAINAFDANGDVLSYDVATGPTQGTVTVGADGFYTYTPSEEFAATGGTDTFTVTLADNGFHLPFVGSAGAVEIPVSVTVAGPEGLTTAVADGSVRVAVSADGRRVYVLGANQTVSLIDTDPTTPATGVVGTVYVGSSRTVATEDPATGDQTLETFADSSDFTDIAVSPIDNRVYVVNRTAGSVSVIDTNPTTGDAEVIDTIAVGAGSAGITLSHDGALAYVIGRDDGKVAVIDTAARSVVGTVDVGGSPSAGVVSPDGSRLYVANLVDNTVSVIDTASRTVVDTVAVGGRPVAVATSSDGRYVYTANLQSNSVSMIDTATGAVTDIVVGGSPSGIAVSPDGAHLYVTEAFGNRLAVIDTAARAVVTRVAVGDGPHSLALSPDGHGAYVANLYDGTVSQVALAPLPTAAPTTQLLGSTKGFRIYNVSGQELTMTAKQGNFENGGPAVGSIMAPGTYIGVEVVVPFLSDNLAIETWKTADGQTTFQADTWAYSWPFGTQTFCGAGGGGRQCASNPDRLEIYFIDAPNTVISLDGPSGQQQAKVLNELCYEGSLASCEFEKTEGQLYYNDPVLAPGSIINDTSVEQRRQITVTTEVTNTINWKVSFTIGSGKLIESIVNKSFTAEFGHSWSKKRTFTDTSTVIAPPHTAVRVYSSDPVDRLYGRFVLQMYNTTWDLSNVYFDSGDEGGKAIVTYKETPIVPTDPAVS